LYAGPTSMSATHLWQKWANETAPGKRRHAGENTRPETLRSREESASSEKRYLAGPNLLHQQVGSRASEIALRARKRHITGSHIFFERRR